MKRILLIACCVCFSVSCRRETSAQGKAMLLIPELSKAWKDSVSTFADLSHRVCVEIEYVPVPSNRLECITAYQKAFLGLPKYQRECDEDGFWARMNAQTEIERITSDIDTSSKWHFTLRCWQSLMEEINHYDAYGTSKPMRIVGGVAEPTVMKNAIAKADSENRVRKVALERRHYANRLRGCLRTMYRPVFEYALKEDWNKISVDCRDELMQMVRDVTGRYPDWYLDEKKKSEKDYLPGTRQ